MTEQNRGYIQKEIGGLLSEIWRSKGLAEQEYDTQCQYRLLLQAAAKKRG